jgi:hypothetical protein
LKESGRSIALARYSTLAEPRRQARFRAGKGDWA